MQQTIKKHDLDWRWQPTMNIYEQTNPEQMCVLYWLLLLLHVSATCILITHGKQEQFMVSQCLVKE